MQKKDPPPLPTLPMQLMLAMGTWLASPSALRCAKSALPHWKPELSLPQNEALESAVAKEAKTRAADLLSGILRYMEAPSGPRPPEKPVIWQRGNARLIDYGLNALKPEAIRSVALFVPSLINRYYILDLEEERSLLRYLPAQGVYPLVLDWGVPGDFEKDFGCAEYITKILLPAIDHLHAASGKRIDLAGYCMGGVLALAAAQLRRSKVRSLALLATPWDFHCESFRPFVVDKEWRQVIARLIDSQKTLSADAIQSLFYMTDPWVFEQKFRRFAGLDPKSRAAGDFVALERWVNDGVPMTANMARNCLIGWAQENRLVEGWSVAGKKINPKMLKLPTFIAIPHHDHVVPRDCAMALADAMKGAQVIHPSAGHVGMVMGSKAKRELWQPLAQWLTESQPNGGKV
jgi:polyhydroxyalkanoate synthase subunit PhaC